MSAFAEAADRYLAAGFSPIPVGHDKRPLVSGYHGRSGKRPGEDVIERWIRKYGDANIAIRLPDGMIGIDVDGYDGKAGAETLVEFEGEFGAFPPTVISTARDDGVSGIRLYRIPEGYEGVDWPGQLGPGIDIVTWYERYMIVSPSWHAGANAQYRWWLETDDGRIPLDGIGGILIPELPAKMADAIASTSRAQERAVVDDIVAWLEKHGKGDMCDHIRHTCEHWTNEIMSAAGGGGIHDAARDGSKAVLGDCAAGHPGVWTALSKMRSVFLSALESRSRIRRHDAVDEWHNMVSGGVMLAAAIAKETVDPCRELEDMEGISPVVSVASICADDIVQTATEWLAHPLIPKGALTIIDGDPGQGKSLITTGMAANAANNDPILPGCEPFGREINSGMIGGEDDLSSAVVGRLRAAGYAMNRRVFFLPLKKRKGKIEMLTFPEGVGRVRGFILTNSLEMLIIDPITSFLGENVKTHVDSSVRAALMPLAEVARETGCAIVLVRHLNKNGQMNAMYRGGGSIAFSAIARSGLITGVLPEGDGQFGLAQVKCSYAEKFPSVMAYSVVGSDEDDSVPVVKWHESVDIDAEALVKGPVNSPGPIAWAQAELEEKLAELFESKDTWRVNEIKDELRAAGCSLSQGPLDKVRKRMGIVSRRVFRPVAQDYWVWTMVPDKFPGGSRH